jgi:hypothetical protein
VGFRNTNGCHRIVGIAVSTSIRMSLCRSTPLRIFATVMQAMMTMAPDIKPWAHAERISPFVSVGLLGRIARVSKPLEGAIATGLMVLSRVKRKGNELRRSFHCILRVRRSAQVADGWREISWQELLLIIGFLEEKAS